MKQKVKVVQKEDEVVERSVLAQAIVDISEAANKLRLSGLNRRAIVLLLSESSRVGRKDVEAVLTAIEYLKKDFCS